MKRIWLCCVLVLAFATANCQSTPNFDKVAEADLNPQRLKSITHLSDAIMTAQRAGGFYPLSRDEAIDQMITGLNETVQKQAYSQLHAQLGEYQSLEFDHMMRTAEEPVYEIYRFRGRFDGTDSEVEIRAVTDAGGKLAGFYVRPWKDKL